MQGRKGFYVDSGANDATHLSNTLFFDKCLGWSGLCVEPNPAYHQGIKEKRSCHLIAECISDRKRTVKFQMSMEMGSVQEDSSDSSGLTSVQCSPLKEMLKRIGKDDNTIDLWSLDVEGHEMQVLNAVDFTQIPVKTIIVEDFWISGRELDLLLGQSGFIKYHQLPIDSVYLNLNDLDLINSDGKTWYPSTFKSAVDQNMKFREMNKQKLKC